MAQGNVPKNLFLKLNNLDFDPKIVSQIIRERSGGRALPDSLKAGLGEKWDKFVVDNGKLFYRDGDINLEVVTPDKRDAVLQALYDDPVYSAGAGIKTFYKQVCTRYVGIKREDVGEFLQRQKHIN